MKLIANFTCECGCNVKYPLSNQEATCLRCARRWRYETQNRDDGTWGRLVPLGQQLPAGWNSIDQAPHNRYLVLLCPAQTVNLQSVVIIGKYQPEYREFWIDEQGDALSNGGYAPIAWRELSDFGLSDVRPTPSRKPKP